MKRKKRWIVMMSLLVLISIWGVFTPETPELWMPDQYFNAANVAWMVTIYIHVHLCKKFLLTLFMSCQSPFAKPYLTLKEAEFDK